MVNRTKLISLMISQISYIHIIQWKFVVTNMVFFFSVRFRPSEISTEWQSPDSSRTLIIELLVIGIRQLFYCE